MNSVSSTDAMVENIRSAVRSPAAEVTKSDNVVCIRSWDALGKQVLGTSVGFPVAQLLRHAAGTAAEWRDIRLPVELKMLKSFLAIDLANEFATVGPARAVSDFKKQILPILGQHVIERQPHQRSRDFSLLLLIVSDADRRKDGLVERRRIAPDTSRSIFGIPIFTHGSPSFGAAYLGSAMLHCNM